MRPPDLFRHPPEPNRGTCRHENMGEPSLSGPGETAGFHGIHLSDAPETPQRSIQRSSKGETLEGTDPTFQTDTLAQRKGLIEGIVFWEASISMSKKVGHATCLRGGITKLRDTIAMIYPSKHQ